LASCSSPHPAPPALAAQVTHRIYSLDSHRLALYLDSRDKLLPLMQVRRG
jgi:hypothetical protein